MVLLQIIHSRCAEIMRSVVRHCWLGVRSDPVISKDFLEDETLVDHRLTQVNEDSGRRPAVCMCV